MLQTLRRRELLVGVAALAVPAMPGRASAEPFVVTPGQTEGPFYPVTLPADRDFDLVRVQGAAAQALGTVTHLTGRVLDKRGKIVQGAMVEIWQCDANGIYHHPRAGSQGNRDSAFQGYGSIQVGRDGSYAFRTIRPVAYPGRTPHIHFKVHAPGAGVLTTQMYVAGEPLNGRDGLYRSIRDVRARESVTVAFSDAADLEAGALKGTFDIILNL